MKRFKTLSLAMLSAALTLGVVAQDAVAQAAPPLTVQVYNADGGSFHVNAMLAAGKTDWKARPWRSTASTTSCHTAAACGSRRSRPSPAA